MESDHPMHHPLHIHGAGRFLVLSRDGVVEPNLIWTDTVLITTGQVLDLLLDVVEGAGSSLPGRRRRAPTKQIPMGGFPYLGPSG